jgi:hypothetical protein
MVTPTDPSQTFINQYAPYKGQQGSQDLLGQYTSSFIQDYKNLTGQEPTQDVINSYLQNAVGSLPHADTLGYPEMTGLAQSYITNQFAPQVTQYSQQQQANQLPQTQKMVQDLINQTMGNTASQFSDPNSQLYKSFSGGMNNMGITPSSGAFQEGAGSAIANAGMTQANAALGSIGIPAASGIQGMTANPYNQAVSGGNAAGSSIDQYMKDLQNFTLQSQLASNLSNQAQPSGIQKDIGMASGAAQGLGGLGMGMGGASQATSYVCMELIRRDLLCESDMDDFHVHIMPAMFKKGRAFWKYAIDGKRLVDSVNARGLNWSVFKPLLFDRVMEESDSCKAVDLYADACHQLCLSADPELWDKRVFRESFWDSLIFLPRLFFYTPFLRALWKCFRIKMLFIYDKPRCYRHAH